MKQIIFNVAVFNIPVLLYFSFVFALENNFSSWENIINKFRKIRQKVPEDILMKSDESSAGLLRIDLNL